VQETVDIPKRRGAGRDAGHAGVVVTNPKLLAQFGGGSFTLNRARYTRHHLAGSTAAPQAICRHVPGFEGGAGDFKVLATNLITRARRRVSRSRLGAFDRRSNQLEDMAGSEHRGGVPEPEIALDWLYGGELTLPLDPLLVAGPNRRAVFYDQTDVPFIASWTNLVFSRDIDAVVEEARSVARNQNVFLGGHSAGTGFTARYARPTST
jgi:hypothetical protein